MKTIEEEHYSKYLLVDERKDEIIGVVSVKDKKPLSGES